MAGARCAVWPTSTGRRPVADLGRFGRFFVVGALGFAVDAAGVITLTLLGLHPLVARVLSFILATIATYSANRRWTFRDRVKGNWMRGWVTYVSATSLGAALNYTTFAAWLAMTDRSPMMILAGTAAGSAVGLLFNYSMSQRVVFRR